MKPIFDKFFSGKQRIDLKEDSDLQFILPPPAAIHELSDIHTRALVGWTANRMGRLLQYDKQMTDSFIYFTFSSQPFKGNEEKEFQFLMHLADRLVESIKEGQDIYWTISEMKLHDKYHRCLLEVYDEIKNDILFNAPSEQSDTIDDSKQNEVWKVYRDVIYAATQRKFLLIDKEEVVKYKEGDILCEISIKERPDIPKAREKAKQCLSDIGVPQTKVMSKLLVISEAITNILKHAEEGTLTVIADESYIKVVVTDKGPGFPLKILPNATLMAGYSTKKSLGQGFTLMMKMAEQVLLATTPSEGSTIILLFNRNEGEKSDG